MSSEWVGIEALDQAWLRLNAPFMVDGNRGPNIGPQWICTRRASPLVITAVHGVIHYRADGTQKASDANTGGLALCVAEATGTSTAVVLRPGEGADANSNPDHPFKRALVSMALVGAGRFLLDLHGVVDDHGIDVTIGRGPLPRTSAALADAATGWFEAEGFSVDPDGTLTGLRGEGPGTVTAFAQQHGSAAIQVEIARRNRSFSKNPERRRAVLRSLVGLAADIAAGNFDAPRSRPGSR